jgi:hypothetical protein
MTMARIPSIGLAEILVIAVIMGLALLAAAVVVAIVMKRRTQSGARAAGPHESERETKGARNSGRWIVLAIFLAVLVLPLLAAVGGVLFVIPVRRTQMMAPGGIVVIPSTTSAGPAPAASEMTPTGTPDLTPAPGPRSVDSSQRAPRTLAFAPETAAELLILPSLAGLVVVLGAGVAAIISRMWPAGSITSDHDVASGKGLLTDAGDGGGGWADAEKLRYLLLAFAFWLALSAFLILDIVFSASLYSQFVVIYAAFWVLIGALLLHGSPRRERLLVLGLFVVVVSSIYFVDWNSRKPFLRDLYRVQEGMTVEQVDQIMGHYMGGTGWPARPLGLADEASTAAMDELTLPGRLVYRHTNEGWGNSDWGEITFENGRVVEVRFLPD